MGGKQQLVFVNRHTSRPPRIGPLWMAFFLLGEMCNVFEWPQNTEQTDATNHSVGKSLLECVGVSKVKYN